MNKLYINKKLLLLLLAISIVILTLSRLVRTHIPEAFGFSNEEITLIKSMQDESIDLGITNHFIWLGENFEVLENQIYNDIGVKFAFHIINDGEISIAQFPSAVYAKSSDINKLGYLSSNYVSVTSDYEVIPFSSFASLIEALDHHTVDSLLLPYSGDYLYENDLSIIELSYANSLPLQTDTTKEIAGILNKLFLTYAQNGFWDDLINESNNQRLLANKQTLKMNRVLKVGIEQYPPISYIKNNTIYGLGIAILNNYSNFSDVDFEYTIGYHDKIQELLETSELDIILTTSYSRTESTYFSEPFVVISQTDTKLYTNINLFPQENYLFFKSNPTKISGSILTDFDALTDVLKDGFDGYLMVPNSMYELINEKLDVPKMHLNLVTDYSIFYSLLGNENLIGNLQNFLTKVDSNRLYRLSFNSIDDEKTEKINITIFVVTLIIVLFLFIIFIIVRIILNMNEKLRLNYLFNHDQLTYLLNSHGLKKIFGKISNPNGIMILIDLRRFKLLNDTYGYDVGDQILVELSNQFSSIENIVVAKTSGDQFTILVDNPAYDGYLTSIINTFETFKTNKPEAQKLNLSMCYVPFPEFASEYDTIIKYLESAMYYAKSLNILNEWVRFDESMYTTFLEEQELAIEIEKAIENEDFSLFYQPQTNLETEKTIGAEVLVRWFHKERGTIYPDQFLGVAEKNGLMRKLDMYMIRKASEQVKYWQNHEYKKMKISVNMSTYTFESKDMSSELIDILLKAGVDTSWLVIEITEESGFSNIKKANELMTEIKNIGVRFALDDFGKGYSSLNYLNQLPFDFLKIDKAFVDHIHTDEKSKTLYHLITELAKLYNMQIIAEGVEYIDQINVIKQNMQTIIQGYYYSKPLPLEAFETRIQNQ